MQGARMGRGPEFDLIRELLSEEAAPPPPAGVRVGPGDDCAIVAGDGIVLSSDLSIEGVHFLRDWLSVEEIGYRAVAAALSDLAAVAARPIGVLVSMALPDGEAAALVPELRSGIAEACRLVGAVVLGGDLSRSPHGLVLDVTVVGEASDPVLRTGARPGDALWVTGYLGGSAAAVRTWGQGGTPSAAARRAFVRPVPRVQEARWLREKGTLHALIDLSDGLAGDAGHLAAASEVMIILEREAIPIHSAARAWTGAQSRPEVQADGAAAQGEAQAEAQAAAQSAGQGEAREFEAPLEFALRGGEDYELCFAAPAGSIEPLRAEFRERFGVPLARVGSVHGGEGGRVTMSSADSAEPTPLRSGGYSHFHEGEHRT